MALEGYHDKSSIKLINNYTHTCIWRIHENVYNRKILITAEGTKLFINIVETQGKTNLVLQSYSTKSRAIPDTINVNVNFIRLLIH